MARYTATTGFEKFSGALKKEKTAERLTVTRIKNVKDPLTGEVVGQGHKEIFIQNKRNYRLHPMTDGEQRQREKWREACKAAAEIVKDTSHPRYMELYYMWRAQLSADKPCKQFPNFVRSVLVAEGRDNKTGEMAE
ncbi:MAG: hypothetical protein IJ204_00060 [Paludibacteraceae bacterium]|nr:hypothetical protein [Paludibacteraceae bacterium]